MNFEALLHHQIRDISVFHRYGWQLYSLMSPCRYAMLMFPGRCVEITCFFGPDGSGRSAGVTGADGVTGHHSKLVLYPGVELHSHGRLHVSCHGVWVYTQNEGDGQYWGCGFELWPLKKMQWTAKIQPIENLFCYSHSSPWILWILLEFTLVTQTTSEYRRKKNIREITKMLVAFFFFKFFQLPSFRKMASIVTKFQKILNKALIKID